MTRRNSRLAIIAIAAALVLALAPSVSARSAVILDLSKRGDPGLIDVVLQDVTFDRSGTIAVTATVQCFSPDATLVVVDFVATQTRGGITRSTRTFNDDLACNQSFTEVLTASTEAGFVPGRATIEVSAFACVLNCTTETLVAEVVLIP